MRKLALLFSTLLFFAISINAQTTPRTLVKAVTSLSGVSCSPGPPQADLAVLIGGGSPGLYYCDSLNHWALVSTANIPGIFSINGLTGSSQTIAIGTSGSAPAVASAGSTTTINIPAASATATGTVNTSSQTFAGAKTFSSNARINARLGINQDATSDIDIINSSVALIKIKSSSSSLSAGFRATNDDGSSVLEITSAGHSAAGNVSINGPSVASASFISGASPIVAITQSGSDGSIWFGTNSTARASVSSAGFTLYGTTSGSSTITPQAAAGSYKFQLPNTDPTVGQNVFVSSFSSGVVTLGYQDGGSGSTGLYDLLGQADGAMDASQKIIGVKAARAFTLAVTGSVCGADVAATGQTDFTITVNGVTKGILRFPASGTSCTVVSPAGTSIAINDSIKLIGPATPDATLSGVTFTLKSSTPDASAYDLSQQANGDLAPSQVMLNVKAARAFTLPITGSVCEADVPATTQTDFIVTVNGVTKGTLRFAASGTTCTIVSPTSTSISINDKVKIIAPASPDATLAGVTFTLLGSNP